MFYYTLTQLCNFFHNTTLDSSFVSLVFYVFFVVFTTSSIVIILYFTLRDLLKSCYLKVKVKLSIECFNQLLCYCSAFFVFSLCIFLSLTLLCFHDHEYWFYDDGDIICIIRFFLYFFFIKDDPQHLIEYLIRFGVNIL